MKDAHLRIVHLLSCEGPWGDATAALYLAWEQQTMGHDVTMLIKNGPMVGRFLERAADAGVSAVVLSDVDLNPVVDSRTYMWRLFRHLLRYRPRVVHLHERGLTSKLSDILPSRLCLSRTVVSTVQYFGEFDGSDDGASERRRWQRASRLLSAVIAPSDKAAAVQRSAGLRNDRIVVIHNIINTTQIEVAARGPVRLELGLGDDDLLVLFLARLDEVKHPLLTIEAFGRLVQGHPRAHLAMAGTGPLADACADRVASIGLGDSVHLLGFRHDVGQLLKAADIFHTPSEAEAFGNTIVEAIASGTPVITTGVAPMLGEVLPPDGGRFHPVGDVGAAARAMEELADDPRLREQLVAVASEFASREHDPGVLCRRHVALYRQRRWLRRRSTVESASA